MISFESREGAKRSVILLLVILFAIRLQVVFQELPPFQFCDESIYFAEVSRLFFRNEWVTHEFRSGGFNIYPILIFSKVIGVFYKPTEIEILIFGKFFYIVVLGLVAAYGFYVVGLDIGGRMVALICMLSYIFSPYVYSISRYWYPDHYVAAFVIWMIHYSIKYIKSTKNDIKSLCVCGVLFGVCVSIKYTSVVLIAPILLNVIYKNYFIDAFNVSVKKIACNLAFFTLPAGVIFLVLNFSILHDIQGFINGFNFNVINYGPRDFSRIDGIIFYIIVIFVLPLGFVGPLIFVLGLKKASHESYNLCLSTGIVILFFLLIMGTVSIVVNRNSSIIFPYILPFMAVGLKKLIFMKETNKSSYFDFIRLPVLSLILVNFPIIIFCILKDFNVDSRILAREWILDNIDANTTVGVNEFCSGESPASTNIYQVVNDPQFKNNLDYYIINSYWSSRIDASYRTKGLMQYGNQKYIHFYNFNDRTILKFTDGTEDVHLDVPGYRLLQTFKSNGPNIFIYQRVNN